ncbi:MAG: thiamine phosphate synthase, partial [Deltaproteobacteria bacterium]|nr:thiamine phosphate synthase [Deltaproteobacteria bacterium]
MCIRDRIIGVSTHNSEEIIKAQEEGADYINIGPIFETKTREGHTNFLGVDGLKNLKDYAKVPFSVMGGIKERHIPEILAAGGRIIAMVTEITQTENISEKVSKILQKMRECI